MKRIKFNRFPDTKRTKEVIELVINSSSINCPISEKKAKHEEQTAGLPKLFRE